MTEADLLAIARTLRLAGSPCVVVDETGIVRAAMPEWGLSAGEPIAALAPLWMRERPREVVHTVGQRWIRIERIAAAGALELCLIVDCTCQHVVEQARRLSAERSARSALAGATAREMNDAMTIVQGRLELLRAFALDDPVAADRHCSIALEHSARLSSTLHILRMVGATTGTDAISVRVDEALGAALDVVGISDATVQLDLHPKGLTICGYRIATESVLAGILRAMGADGRESLVVSGRESSGRVQIELERGGRRRELDALPLGIATTLLDAVGGTMDLTTEGQVVVTFPAAPGPVDLNTTGDLLVVGRPQFVDSVARLMADQPVVILSENSAEAALMCAQQCEIIGVVAELLLPERCGLTLLERFSAVGLDVELELGILLMTPEPVTRLPSNVRVLTAPWSRNRLLSALTQS